MSSLIINHNTQALNTHRRLVDVDKRMKTSLEHLSSGEKIVRAADGPAALMISEQMRAQIGSVTQAIGNVETAVSVVQTTESALNEVNNLLVSVRSLAIHAANEGANDENMLAADQLEIDNALQSLLRISQHAQFGTQKILDGSRGVNGIAAGKGLTFLSATTKTQGSPDTGFEVRILQAPTKSSILGGQLPADPQGRFVEGVELTVQEGGKVARYTTKAGDDLNVVINSLQNAIDNSGLALDVTPDRVLVGPGGVEKAETWKITHRDFGSESKFTVVSSVPGVLSKVEGIPEVVSNGQDVQGTINSQLAIGRGTVLTAASGTSADGLAIAYSGNVPVDPSIPVGRVTVNQNSLVFQIGPNAGQKAKVALNNVSPDSLAKNVVNTSGFRSLSDINVKVRGGADSTMRIVDQAIDEVNIVRANLGAIQKNALESQLRSLAVAREELTASESVIRDADMAAELSEFTRNQVISQAAMAMLSQAHQAPKNVLGLLRNA